MDLGERYLELVLRFRRLAPSQVESYVGPAELARRIDDEPAPEWTSVAEQAARLAETAAATETVPERARWVAGQARGIQAACERSAGGPVGYRELAARCHGIEVDDHDVGRFEQAHELIMRALPGPGSARERFAAWTSGQLVSGDRLVRGFEALAGELRARCRERWALPEGERVTFEMVCGHRWAANADYRGGLQSVIQINVDRPIAPWRMVELVAHEGYPGHHTERVCKAAELVSGRGWSELDVWLFPTPQALMAEGIAMLAPEILLGDEIEEVAAASLRPLGIHDDTAGSAAVRRAQGMLLPVRANLALMHGEGSLDRAGMLAYARRWLLEDDAYVARVVDGVLDPVWPTYAACYPEGLRLCRAFVAGDPRRYDRLLREQLTPADLSTAAPST